METYILLSVELEGVSGRVGNRAAGWCGRSQPPRTTLEGERGRGRRSCRPQSGPIIRELRRGLLRDLPTQGGL